MQLTLAQVDIQTKIRQLVLQATALEFVFIAADKADVRFFTQNMAQMIDQKMINGLEIVVKENGDPIAGCTFRIDWARHQGLCEVEGEIAIDELADGEIYFSSREILAVFKRYIDAVYARCSNPEIELWWFSNPAVKNAMGAEAFYGAVGLNHDPQEAAKHAREYEVIRTLKNVNAKKGRFKALDFIDTQEAKGGVW